MRFHNFHKIVIATRNKGKLREFRSLLSETDIEVLGLSEIGIEADCEENGASFEENARLKALFYAGMTELPMLADDSGLEVTALGGRPGIYSSRYAGPGASDADRIRKLIGELEASGPDRSARFVCALCLTAGGKILQETIGECRGVITDVPRGGHGFGYDPVFFFPALNKTYAELAEDEKNRISHRARAVQQLIGI
jgi:XTP/dITP diphosphohydrolase